VKILLLVHDLLTHSLHAWPQINNSTGRQIMIVA